MTGEEYGELFRQACDLFENNEYDRAEEICNKLIEINDKQAPIFNLLALIKDKKGDIESAINNSERSILLKNDDYIYYSNLGNFLTKKRELNKALYVLEKSIEINPNFHISNFNLGNLHKLLDNKGEAQRYFERAIEIKPDYVEALNNLGLLYINERLPEVAKKYYKQALKFIPNDCEITLNLVIALNSLNEAEESELNLKKIISICPQYKEPYKILSNLLISLLRIEEAKYFLSKYVNLLTNEEKLLSLKIFDLKIKLMQNNFFYNNVIEVDNYRANLDYIISNTNYFEDKRLPQVIFENNLYFSTNYTLDGRDTKNIKIRYYNLFYKCFSSNNLNLNKGKVKLGFLVTKNNEGLFLKFMSYIINNLKYDLFDVFIICDQINWNNFLKERFDKHIKVIFLEPFILKTSKKILDIGLDILYYWEIGTDSENYFLPFFRLAPVQCTSIGWPDTTGIKTVDYFISSDLLEIETAQEHYSEELIKLNKLPLYFKEPKINSLKTLEDFGLSGENNIYFCAQNLHKVHPDFDKIVEKILNFDSKSLIVFVSDEKYIVSNLLKKRFMLFTETKNFLNRIVFIKQQEYYDYLNLIKLSSVVLDTLYFGGATTSYDCFAMDTPIVTCPWTHERGRYTLGCYKQMGIEGLVANSLDEYVDLAVKTANDNDFRAKIVKDIKDNKHKLFEDKELINEYNNLFRKLANR